MCDILSHSVSVAPGHEHPWPHCIKEGVQYGSSLPRGNLPDLAGLNTVCFRELGIWIDEAFREDPVTLRRLEKARVTVKGKGLWDLRAAEGQTRPALLHPSLCHGTAAHSALLLYKGHLQLLLIWNKLAAPPWS